MSQCSGPQAHGGPHIVEIEFLGGTDAGVGTRLRETRPMNGRETVTEPEVTELV